MSIEYTCSVRSPSASASLLVVADSISPPFRYIPDHPMFDNSDSNLILAVKRVKTGVSL